PSAGSHLFRKAADQTSAAFSLSASENLGPLHELSQYLEQRVAIPCTDHFTNRVHGKLGHADIQRGHAQISRSQRPDRAATPHVTAHHKRLVRQTQFIADVTIKGGGTA